MSAQRLLDYSPDPPAERVMAIGPTPQQIRKSKKPQTVKVLRMLQAGPCSTRDFLAAFIGNHKARVYELRQVGHVINRTDLSENKSLYELVTDVSSSLST